MNFFLQLGKKVDILQDVQAYNHRQRVNSMVRLKTGPDWEHRKNFRYLFFFFFIQANIPTPKGLLGTTVQLLINAII